MPGATYAVVRASWYLPAPMLLRAFSRLSVWRAAVPTEIFLPSARPGPSSWIETIPGLRYAVKWKKAYYGTPDLGWLIEMVAYDVSVNVVFFGGAEFDPPPPLGETERTRYVKVKTLDEAQGPEMRTWLEQAARVPGWR